MDSNSKLRAETKNHIERYSYKLMSNAIFRKTMENVQTHMEYELVVDKKEQ